MTHYCCDGGCEGVSATPGNCQAESCQKHDQALLACDCQEPEHLDKIQAEKNESSE